MTTDRREAPPEYARLFRRGYVHRDLYVDAQLFEEEMRQLHGRTWVYIGHESEIPQPHDFVTRRIGRRPVILSRTAAGDIAVVFNRCTHRGATVCREARGNARSFTCGYHAWTFANDGRCTGVPLRKAYGPDLKLADLNLGRPARVDSYRGFIFASVSAEVPPLIEHLAAARGCLDQWLDRDGGRAVIVRNGTMPFRIHGNWKLVYDNAGDGYHPPFSHLSMLQVFGARYGDVDMRYYNADFDDTPMYGKDLGNGHTLLDQRPAMHRDSAWKRQHVMPGYEVTQARLTERYGETEALRMLDASTGSGMNLNIFPNLLIIGNQIQLLEPTAVNRTTVHWFSTTLEGAPEEINTIRMRMQEDFPSFGEVDDAANFEACQEGLETVPEMEWVDVRRHLDTGVGKPDEADGLWREPMSSDLHLRSYYAEWLRLMNRGRS
ncbi:MAG: aromatic ring-hydroxylating oxygenase subunit alpha [Panacagrimonas sp.]